MRDIVFSPFYKLDIYHLLLAIRNDGLNRTDEMQQILNAVVGEKADWQKKHCRDYYRALLEEYLDEYDLRHLLAVSGYGEGYEEDYIFVGSLRRKNNAAQRRNRFAEIEKRNNDVGSMLTGENRLLAKMAEAMGDDYQSGRLLELVIRMVPAEELIELGLGELVPEEERERIRREKLNGNETSVAFFTGENAGNVLLPIYAVPRNADEYFTSREDILGELSEAFRNKDEKKLVILSGMGGVGKTQIALKYAYTMRNEYGVVIWLDATNEETLAGRGVEMRGIYGAGGKDATSVAGLTGKDATDVSSSISHSFRRFISQLGRKRVLIIYDNADYLDEDGETKKAMQNTLLSYLPEGICHVLITTRCNARFNNGTIIRVDVFQPEIAEQYMIDFTGLKASAELRTLTERLGYLPLALTYAGAYMKTHGVSVNNYLRLWDEAGMELMDKKGYAEDTVKHAIAISLKKLRDVSLKTGKRKVSDAEWLLMLMARVEAEYIPLWAFVEMLKEQYAEFLMVDEWYDWTLEEQKGDGWLNEKNIAVMRLIRYLYKMLDDELRVGEAIKTLKQYSLVDYKEAKVYIHPLMRECLDWYFSDIQFYGVTSELFERAGDKEMAEKYREIERERGYMEIPLSLDELG